MTPKTYAQQQLTALRGHSKHLSDGQAADDVPKWETQPGSGLL